MKLFSLLLPGLLVGMLCFGQKDPLKDVKLSIYGTQKDWSKSKDLIDKVLVDPKNANLAEAYYWKGYIYHYAARDEKAKTLCTDCRWDAFAAMQKYVELDPTMKEIKADTNALFYDIFYSYYDEGAKLYNNKDFQPAIDKFDKAIQVERYIYNKGFAGPGNARALAFDTTMVLYAGVAASQLKNDDLMLNYYQQLMDAGVNELKYMEIYQAVAEVYRDKKDNAKWAEAVARGRKIFPAEDYWYQAEMDLIPKTAERSVVFAKYEDQVKDKSKSFFITYNYAVELFKYVYNGDAVTDKEQRRTRLTEMLKLAIAADTTAEGFTLMAKHMDYWSGELMDSSSAIKGVKPADTKRKADLKAESAKKGEEAMQYADKAIQYYAARTAKFTGRQKTNYKDALEILSRYHQYKGDAARAKEYKDKKAAVDKL